MSRFALIGIFAVLAATALGQAVGAGAAAVADPDLRAWAEAVYFALKAGVGIAFGLFIVLRGPSRRPSRDPAAFVACATAITAVVLLGGPSDSATTPLLVVGDVIALLGCAWLLASALALGRCFGILPEARGLVTRGPYRLVRHPIYLGEYVAAAGLVIATPTARNIALLAAFVAAQAVRMRLEEHALTAEFPEYAEYAAGTPRLVPVSVSARPLRRWRAATLAVVAIAALLAVTAAEARLRAPAGLTTGPGELVPSFAWAPVSGADRYEFHISADSGFNSPVLGTGQDRFLTRNTRATLKKSIPNGTYWWRVRAVDKEGTAGSWSAPRSIRKAWSAAPSLQSPPSGSLVEYPETPFRLAWSPVHGAAKYIVALARDPALGSLVDGKTIETAATSFTRAGALGAGEYFWRITPVDAAGNPGAPSGVASFVWLWRSGPASGRPVNPRVNDLIDAPEAFDAQFSWDALPGAARYDLEVSTSQDFAPGSKVCCTGATIGTSLSPTVVLKDNRYYWRVRGIDVDGNAGEWNEGPVFEKRFDKVPPVPGTSIKNVRMRDNLSDPGIDVAPAEPGYQTRVPIMTWDPVPGASSYQVEVAPFAAASCNWTSQTGHWAVFTSVNAWTPLGAGWNAQKPYPDPMPVANDLITSLTAGASYCARVRARTDRDPAGGDVYGDYTYVVDGTGSATPGAAFTWHGYPAGTPCSAPCTRGYLGAGDYVLPASGELKPRTPFFTWRPLLRRAETALKNTGGATAVTLVALGEGAFGNDFRVKVEGSQLHLYDGAVLEESYAYTSLADLAAQINSPDLRPYPFGSDMVSATVNAGVSGPLQSHAAPVLFDQPGKTAYFVLVAKDPQFSNIVDYAFTQVPAYAPRSLFRPTTYADETTSYYWVVLPANAANGSGAEGTPLVGAARAFEKRSIPPQLLEPAGGADILTQPTFRWTPVEGVRRYRVQVAQDPSFGSPIDDVLTTSTAYTSNTTYPADTVLHWRVRADDENLIGLTWSGTGTFQRRLPAPVPSGSNAAAGDFLPTWLWNPILSAVSYDVHADLPDGTQRDLVGLRTAALTPILMYGTGVFRWKVRANFAKAPFGSVAGPYSPVQTFTRTIREPTGARASVSKTHVLLSWEPKPTGIKNYRVQISSREDFSALVEDVLTDNTSYAPPMTHPAYLAGLNLYWRVAAVDEGRNVGDWSPTQAITSPKRMRLAITGAPKRRRTVKVSVRVAAMTGKPLVGATVRVSGAGIRARAGRTKKNGAVTFKIRALKRGTVTYRVTKTGFQTAIRRARVK